MAWVFVVLSLASSVAQAQEGGGGGPGFLAQAFPFIALFFIFYFLILRPQTKKQKAHLDLVSNLKRGDEVLTSGGIFGTIEGLTDKYITLEVADGVRIRILRGQINSLVKQEVKND